MEATTPASAISPDTRKVSSTEAVVAKTARVNRVANRSITHPTPMSTTLQRDGPSTRGRRQRSPRPVAHTPSAEDDVDEELVELARLRFAALAYLSSPYGRQRDPEGYVTQQEHDVYDRTISRFKKRYFTVERHRLVKIESLPDMDQNCVYENVLYQATIPEVRRQYEINCKRLEKIRSNMLKAQKTYKRDQRPGNIDYDAWCSLSSQIKLGPFTGLAAKAEKDYDAALGLSDDKVNDRTALNGVIRLLERCEGILKKADKGFVPNNWTSQPLELKKRWADGRRGWTGLEC